MTAAGYEPAAGGHGYNFTIASGAVVAAVTSSIRGLRDFRAALMDLAIAIDKRPGIRRATLIVLGHGLKPETAAQAWEDACHTLRPQLRSRLELLAINKRGLTSLPVRRSRLTELAASFQRHAFESDVHLVEPWVQGGNWTKASPQPLGRPNFNQVILKILLLRHLQRQGPISNKTLARLAGCSYPTVAKSLLRLRPYLAEHSNRSVELASWPQAPWEEIVALSPRNRNTIRFVDASGEPLEPVKMIARLKKLKISRLAVGGVLAARYWDPQIDLHGTPRLDISVHAVDGNADLRFVKKLDPALRPSVDPGDSVSLAVHTVYRSEDMFTPNPKGRIPWADPVETLLDLHELRFANQAEELAARLLARGQIE